MTETENILSPFNLTERLQIFSYLVSSNRVRWYRVIMRVFLQRHRELYRYQLTAQEVRDAVRDSFDPEYTLEQCQNDLAALKEWGNIITFYDASRATSIASFLSPALLYQATPAAIAVETFLDEQMRASANSGALRQGDLPRLWESLQQLNEALLIPVHAMTATRARAIAEEWQRAFEIWNTMAREAAQYLANMINAAQQSRPDLEAFQFYKAAVVAYVHGFAQSLTQYSPRIRGQFAEWAKTGRRERLIEIVARHLDPPSPTLESHPSAEELLQDARNQADALENWFAEGKNADSFRRNALAEVDKVVRRASILASTARPSANYAAQLHTLAQQLLAARDGETAQQLFSVAFANILPIHMPESLAGTASAVQETHQTSVWEMPPAIKLRLRPVNRSSRGNLPLEDPIIDNRTILRELVAQHEQKVREQRARFARLFASNVLDIGTIEYITPADRSALLEVIDACLGQSQHQYHAPDGSVIVLHNPDEAAFTVLDADDGVLLLPRYRMERYEVTEDGFNPSFSIPNERKDIGSRYLPKGEVYTPNPHESSGNAPVSTSGG
ncbi:MAG: TIGR02677 family protein [Chloroflexi bacterium]|nr:MAG: TIGR02677 family protein [Chloroflexota bacterium]